MSQNERRGDTSGLVVVNARRSGCDLGMKPEARWERWAGARALWERVERTKPFEHKKV